MFVQVNIGPADESRWIVGACERTVVIPHRVGNFIVPCIVEGIALSCLRAGLPRMMVYGDGAGMTVNLVIARRQRPAPPKHTSSLIFPNGFTLSPENPDTVVSVFASLAFIFGWSMLKQCSYMISTDAPSSMCILLTKYPSISSSITKASSDKSLAGTDGKVIGTFIQLSSVILRFLLVYLSTSPESELPCFLVYVGSHYSAGGEPHKVYDVPEPCGMVYGPVDGDLLYIPPYVDGHSTVPQLLSSEIPLLATLYF
ncbi:hypothetical protein Tco_0546110 [Tanacetum coccineum]